MMLAKAFNIDLQGLLVVFQNLLEVPKLLVDGTYIVVGVWHNLKPHFHQQASVKRRALQIVSSSASAGLVLSKKAAAYSTLCFLSLLTPSLLNFSFVSRFS
jgi:hypothetical protein